MNLSELFKLVPDQQEVKLFSDGFDKVTGIKETLECVLNEIVLNMSIGCVEAGSDCDLKVWVRTNK